jgi:hypothetical protein
LIVWPADGLLPVDGFTAADHRPPADEGEE